MSKRIGILGCGWLGKPLAKSLLATGHTVYGSTTSEEKLPLLEAEGITSFLVRIHEDRISGNITALLQGIDVLIINVPPRLRGDNKGNFVDKMQLLHGEIKKTAVKKLVFVSSTSVYGDNEGEVTEKTIPQPNTESGRQLLASEAIFRSDKSLEVCVIRFGGLLGPDRHPIRVLSGKTGLSNGNAYINLIHLDDCIAILGAVLQGGWWNEIFNAVYPFHPTKKEYYTQVAHQLGLPAPNYEHKIGKSGKVIHAFNLINVKKYQFQTSIVG